MPIAVTCGKCEGRFNAPDAAVGRRGKCPKCGELISIMMPSLATSSLTPPKPPAIPPTAPAATGRPVTLMRRLISVGRRCIEWFVTAKRRTTDTISTANIANVPDQRASFNARGKFAIGIGTACLTLLAVSPFFNWVTVLAAGATGMQGNGKILLNVSLVVGAILGAAILSGRQLTAVALLAQAWGTIAALWMTGEMWNVSAFRDSPELRSNIFGLMLAAQVSTGVGLYMGLIGGAGMAIAFALLALPRLKSARIFTFTQSLSAAVGIGIAAAAAHHSAGFRMPSLLPNSGAESLWPGIAEANLNAPTPEGKFGQPMLLGQIEVTPLSVERSMDKEAREPFIAVTMIVANRSEGQVFAPFPHATARDNFGNELDEFRFPFYSDPSLKDLRPGESSTLTIRMYEKIKTASSYVWEISVKADNKTAHERFRLNFSADDFIDGHVAVVPQPVPPTARKPAQKRKTLGTPKSDRTRIPTELTLFVVSGARVYYEKDSFIERPTIEMNVTNGTPFPVSRAYFHAVLASPGRSVPWLEADFNYQIAGGLESGESATWSLSPNMFGEWKNTPKDRTDLVLTVTTIRLDGTHGNPLFNAD